MPHGRVAGELGPVQEDGSVSCKITWVASGAQVTEKLALLFLGAHDGGPGGWILFLFCGVSLCTLNLNHHIDLLLESYEWNTLTSFPCFFLCGEETFPCYLCQIT